jgi:hypothetical protein
MKHLDVLADAGLITRRKSGRTVTVRLRAQPMREAMAWLSRYERFWTASLDRLSAYAERKEAELRGRGDNEPHPGAPHQGPTVDRVRRSYDRGRHCAMVGSGCRST